MNVSGHCHIFFAFDVGYAVDLDRAGQRLAAVRRGGTFRHPRRAPAGDGDRVPPLRVSQTLEPIRLSPEVAVEAVDASLYDFGGACVTYRIPVSCGIEELVGLSDLLYDNRALLEDARRRIEKLLAAVRDAVEKPALSTISEDYVIFDLDPMEGIENLWGEHAGILSRILRAEPAALSAQEVSDATGCRISYGPRDAAVIDWCAAVLIGDDTEDEREVLEFATVELLQLRQLDKLLDAAIDSAFALLSRRRRWFSAFTGKADALRRVARMQAEYAVVYEGVNSAMKLMGDQYLARMYATVSKRFHVGEWEAGIERKLSVLGSIHDRLSGIDANHRMEMLEWIIILLIAFEIVIYFLE
ncbi:MAG: hypothetical protein MUE73_17010 [Planctomycetes bacterium]|jgi:hypothetical protein|nr:hypothetical protein [Planctomycetota bacterium]